MNVPKIKNMTKKELTIVTEESSQEKSSRLETPKFAKKEGSFLKSEIVEMKKAKNIPVLSK